MIPELGQLALVLALALACIQAIVPLIGAQRGAPHLMALARPAALGQVLAVAVAFAALGYAFAVNDFSVKNVASNSHSLLPIGYRLTATWGSHEGSMLLWVLILAGWTLAVPLFGRGLPAAMQARVVGALGLVSIGFLAFVLLTSNPFVRLVPTPAEGADLNPLLQDLGMILHPPMLYMGYVGFAVSFGFAIAALLGGRCDAEWARQARPWALAAWVFLTIGIALGSWWAYRELGWGGWWFWDPTENASLMPWLAGTALIHMLAVAGKRGRFIPWTLLLSIMVFALSLLGTFIIRSGVLSSVHAFASDPSRGLFILGLLAAVIGGSLGLYAWRRPDVTPAEGFSELSRESLLLGNTLLLMTALVTVMLGTLYPLVLDVLGLGKVSVGPPYFNSVFVPLMAPALFLMGIGPLARWGRASLPALAERLRWALAVALALAVTVPLVHGILNPLSSLGVFLGAWILLASLTGLIERLGAVGWRVGALPSRYWGMQVAHLGMAVLTIGITLVSTGASERDVRVEPGDRVELAGHQFTFLGVSEVRGPNYVADRGTVEVSDGRGSLLLLYPEKRKYDASGMGMTEAAVAMRPFADLYVSLGEYLGGQAWSLRLYHKPFVLWLWLGAGLMALGGGLSLTGRRAHRTRAALSHAPFTPGGIPVSEVSP
jgi:cytochrome c-type biogenesis protein CcmF